MKRKCFTCNLCKKLYNVQFKSFTYGGRSYCYWCVKQGQEMLSRKFKDTEMIYTQYELMELKILQNEV